MVLPNDSFSVSAKNPHPSPHQQHSQAHSADSPQAMEGANSGKNSSSFLKVPSRAIL
jgi:hypothetical protein